MRQAIVPGESVLVPPGPEESEEESSSGNDVAGAAQQHLARCRRITGEAGHLEPAKHHAWRCAAKNREECEVLQIDDGEGHSVDRCAELAESELPTQRTEKSKETAVREEKARGINCGGESPLLKRS